MEALANQLELEVAKGLGQPDDLIFTQASGRPMTRGLILKAVRRAARIAGVKVTPKTLRTSFLTGAAHAGIAAVEIATKTGNSPAVIDRFYVKPIRTAAQEDENMRRMIEYGHVG
jgi:integrase